MVRLKLLLVLVLAVFMAAGVDANAAPISVGVPDAGLTARSTRDGASGITFIDLDSKVSDAGWLTSWSLYAQQSIPNWDSANDDARQVRLVLFRDTGSNYLVVGMSPLETIPKGGWNKVYAFPLTTPIPVQKDDYLGFSYPFQGTDYGDYPTENVPGGVIAFNWLEVAAGGHNVRWHNPWGSTQGALKPGDRLDYDWFNSGPESENGRGRIYSINATGTTVVPLPSTLVCLGSGLAILLRRRQKL